MVEFIPFGILFLCVAVASYASDLGHLARGTKVGRAVGVASFLLTASLLSLFAGLRSLAVGVDTRVMASIFHATRTDSVMVALERSVQEPGYTVLLHLLRRVTDDHRWLLVTMSLATVLVCLSAIRRHTPSFAVSVLVYVGLGAYLGTMNIMRQGLAVALCFGLWAFARNRRFLFLAISAMAISIHVTAIVAVATIVLTRRVIPSRRWLVAVTGVAVFVAATGGGVGLYWTGALNERFFQYLVEAEQSGGGTAVMMGVFMIINVVTFKWATTTSVVLRHAWVLLSIAPIFMAFGLRVVPLGRIEMYFSIFATVVVAGFAKARGGYGMKFLIGVACLIYMVVYLTFWGGLLPYTADLHGSVPIVVVAVTLCAGAAGYFGYSHWISPEHQPQVRVRGDLSSLPVVSIAANRDLGRPIACAPDSTPTTTCMEDG